MKKWNVTIGVAALVASSGLARADEMLTWNGMWMDTIRDVGGAPTPLSRIGAMMSTAVYDSVMAIERTHQPYAMNMPVQPAGTSADAAAAKAAHTVLSTMFPQYKSSYDAQLATSLAKIPAGPGRDAGVALGETVANGIIALRMNDGSDGPMDYTHGNNPGDYRPTYPDFQLHPFTPQWGKVTPWAMTSGSQFRPNGVVGYTNMNDLLTSPEYTAAFNEVKELGALNSATRTAEQTEIGFFWANDVDGTYKPPGHLGNITAEISQQAGLSMAENARLFAMVNVAMADAGIAAWDTKYQTDIDLWRPITGIREADTDGNPDTVQDENWVPLNPFSPPFPAWVSGHATFGAAHAAALAAYFGEDGLGFDFTISSEDPFYLALPGVDGTRTFSSFSEMAEENWRSRIYIGVHWDFDGAEGNWLGTQIGQYVGENFFLIPTPGAGVLFALAMVGGVVRRRRD
ncbi:MAG: phosphatase PAP2 family protein [Phycisphaeraceae bacterium]|nr:MAG: phosphatase PAP2 family protein [Phycisphaeraceae bacterium]